YDTGLGEQVLFLHQNTDPFVVDLYSACDIIVKPQPRRSDVHEPFALELLEATACGVFPIIMRGTPEAQALSGVGITLEDDTFQSIAIHLVKVLRNSDLHLNREKTSDQFYAQQAQAYAGHALIESMRQVLAQASRERENSFDAV